MTQRRAYPRLPYPGLRSFHRDETDLFFGREASVNEMVRRMAASHFLAVLGASGSGKSSLVRTGLLDGLELGLLATAGSWWRVVDVRPGGAPLYNLAAGLSGDADDADIEQMRAFLRRGPRSIIELCNDGRLGQGENLLILVDQFEELFRYQYYEGRQEAEAFVSLLIESARATSASIFVVLTMRSEFLGACALFDGLAEAMNGGQYLAPRLSREQCRQAIEGPARVCGFEIEPSLVNRLLNDLADFAPWDDCKELTGTSQLDQMVRRADQLPLLQHALNRLWVRATQSGNGIVLRLSDYEAIGGLRGALNQHAGEIMASLGEGLASTVEHVFRALTVGSSISDAVRRPTTLAELVNIAGGDHGVIVNICEAFRAPGRNFLTPLPPRPLHNDTIVDISHESLIRQWRALSAWVEREARDSEALRRLSRAAMLAETESGDLLHGRELANLDAWRRESRLTHSWARRHVEDPSAAFDFLRRSLENEKRVKHELDDAKRRQERASRIRRFSIAALVGIVVMFGAMWIVQKRNTAELDRAYAGLQRAQNVTELKNGQLQLLNNDLSMARKAADAQNLELRQTQADLTNVQEQLRETLSDTVITIQEYLGGAVDNLQQSGNLSKSGNLLAGLANTSTATHSLPLHLVDRLAWQVAADNALVFSPGENRVNEMKMKQVLSRLTPRDIEFTLWRNRHSGDSEISVVDRHTGIAQHVFAFDASRIGELKPEGDYFLSPDGRHALLVGVDGRLFRWSVGDLEARRVLDRRWTEGRAIVSAAFDPTTGDIAVIYTQFDTDFLTVIPEEDAYLARSFPVYRIDKLLREAWRDLSLRPYGFEVVAVQGGKPFLQFAWADSEDRSGYGRDEREGLGLLVFDPNNGKAETVLHPQRLTDVYPTTDLTVLHLEVNASFNECTSGPVDLNSLWKEDYSNTCLMDFDLASRRTVGRPHSLPAGFSWNPSGEPFENSDGIKMGGGQVPVWLVLPATDSEERLKKGDVSVLRTWTKGAYSYFNYGSAPLTTSDGFLLAAADELGFIVFDSKKRNLLDSKNGEYVEPLFVEAQPSLPELGGQYIDGTGSLAIGFSDRKWFANQFTSRNTWEEMEKRGERDCLDRMETARNTGEIGGPTTYESDRPFFDLQPIGHASSDFFVVFTDKSAGWLTVRPKPDSNKRLVGSLECIQGVSADDVIVVEHDQRRVVIFDRNPERLVVLRAPGEESASLDSVELVLPKGEAVRSAAFAGANILVVLTALDRLLLFDVSERPSSFIELAHPLPGAEAIYGRGNTLLLLREQIGAPLNGTDVGWTSAVVIDVEQEGMREVPPFVGFIPLPLEDLSMVRLADDLGTVEVIAGAYLMRFQLPPVGRPQELALAVEATSDPSSLKNPEASALALLASAMPTKSVATQISNDPPFEQCSSLLHRSLAFWAQENTDVLAAFEDARFACNEASITWKVPGAALKLLLSDLSNQTIWPEEASILLQAAAEGDGTALRILVLWARVADPTTLLGGAASSLSNSLFPQSPVEGAAPAPAEAFIHYVMQSANSGDPYLQAIVARAIDAGHGDVDAKADAFRHYFLSERLFRLSEDAASAAAMTKRRQGLAVQLPEDRRVAEMAAVLSWKPVPVASINKNIPLDLFARLSGDIDNIDRLASKVGRSEAFDLLKLHLLVLAEESSEAPLKIQGRITKVLLSRAKWPSIESGSRSELLSLYDHYAGAPERTETEKLELALRTIQLLEASSSPIDLSSFEQQSSGDIYLRALGRAASGEASQLQSLAVNFSFGKRPFSHETIRQTEQLSSIRRVLQSRIEFSELLRGRQDAKIARDITKYWLYVAIEYLLYTEPVVFSGEKSSLESWRNQLLRDAFSGLVTLPTSGANFHPDDLSVFIQAVRGLRYYNVDVPIEEQNAIPSYLEIALQRQRLLDRLIEKGIWRPVWARDRGTGEHRVALIEQLADFPAWGAANEKPFTQPDPRGYRLRLWSLGMAAEISRAVARGGEDIIDDVEIDSRYSFGATYPVGLVAGRERRRNQPINSPVTPCDRLASHPYDPMRRSPGVWFNNIDLKSARIACSHAVKKDPADITAKYQLARVLSAAPEEKDNANKLFWEAAKAEYAIAYNNIQSAAKDANVDRKIVKELTEGYEQRVYREHFYTAYKIFRGISVGDGDRIAVRSLAERAAKFGSVEANLALAEDIETEPFQKLYRYLVVSKLLRAQKGDVLEINKIDERISNMKVEDDDAKLAEAMAKAYHVEKDFTLSEKIREEMGFN
ncbi:hypothetical protein GOC31_28550 [Sinorhizobium meliloti]|nr:hypothetical protein [Sinorhizobium meliloti]MDX0252580.1 hypothetical protein [Sinorhizobium meliloti]